MKKLGIEIFKEKKYVTAIPNPNPSPHYRVTFVESRMPGYLNIIIIDGINGRQISKTSKVIDFD